MSGRVGPAGPAPFTNYGPWVRPAPPVSTSSAAFFLEFDGPDVKQAGSVDPDDFQSWARWSGTSFAAPVVVAALAREMQTSAIDAPEAVPGSSTARAC